jgi:hypothetical protein
MTEQQIKDYLEKYSLTTKEKLEEHITQLKRNTKPNLELVSELNYVLVDEENLFFNVFCGEKDTETDWIRFIGGGMKRGNIFEYKPPQKSTEERLELAEKFKKEYLDEMYFENPNLILDKEQLSQSKHLNNSRLNLHISEVINDKQQEIKSMTYLDEVLEQKEENTLSYQSYYQSILTKPTSNWNKLELTFSDRDLDKIKKLSVCDIMNVFSAKETKTEENKGHSTRLKANNPLIVSEKGEELVFDKDCNLKANTPMEEAPLGYFGKRGKVIDYSIGKKETQTVEKAPIFTYCKVNKNALEALALRALYGHKKYNIDGADEDWQNFTRVPNGDEEYANANFRHALNIGEETEEEHLISSAWNAVARLEVYFRKNKK